LITVTSSTSVGAVVGRSSQAMPSWDAGGGAGLASAAGAIWAGMAALGVVGCCAKVLAGSKSIALRVVGSLCLYSGGTTLLGMTLRATNRVAHEQLEFSVSAPIV